MRKIKTAFILTVLIVLAAGCSKEKLLPVPGTLPGNSGGSTGTEGLPHWIEIEILDGVHQGFKYSAEIPNEDGFAFYQIDPEGGEYPKQVSFSLGDEQVHATGIYFYDSNGRLSSDLEEDQIQVGVLQSFQKTFVSKSGTLAVTREELTGLPMAGMAGFRMTFTGIFFDGINSEDTCSIKATIDINLPAD